MIILGLQSQNEMSVWAQVEVAGSGEGRLQNLRAFQFVLSTDCSLFRLQFFLSASEIHVNYVNQTGGWVISFN